MINTIINCIYENLIWFQIGGFLGLVLFIIEVNNETHKEIARLVEFYEEERHYKDHLAKLNERA